MKRYVVLGVNENPKYRYYVPLIQWAWQQFGWDTILFYTGKKPTQYNIRSTEQNWEVKPINGYKSETLAQVSRLYACCAVEGLLMTSDVDMLPLSDYWQPETSDFTTYGRDLTNYHYPICYLAGMHWDWKEIMHVNGFSYQEAIGISLRKQKDMWTLDQDLITERLFVYQDIVKRVDRGTDPRTGYPIGRVDRSNWRLDHKQLIDAHLPHDILTNDASFRKVMELLHTVWPNENWKWWIDYTKEFKKML